MTLATLRIQQSLHLKAEKLPDIPATETASQAEDTPKIEKNAGLAQPTRHRRWRMSSGIKKSPLPAESEPFLTKLCKNYEQNYCDYQNSLFHYFCSHNLWSSDLNNQYLSQRNFAIPEPTIIEAITTNQPFIITSLFVLFDKQVPLYRSLNQKSSIKLVAFQLFPSKIAQHATRRLPPAVSICVGCGAHASVPSVYLLTVAYEIFSFQKRTCLMTNLHFDGLKDFKFDFYDLER